MVTSLVSKPIVWLALGVVIVSMSGISNQGVYTEYSREHTSTTVEGNIFVQYSQSRRADANTDDNETVNDRPQQMTNYTTTNYLSRKNKTEVPFFWTSSSAADDSIIRFNVSNESLAIDTNKTFEENQDSNNMLNKNDWTTQPSWFFLDSERDNGQFDEGNQLISKRTADEISLVFFFILQPVVAVVGCVFNTFNIVVLIKQGFGESTSCYLMAMTMADFTFLLFMLTHFIFISLKRYSYVGSASWMQYDWISRSIGMTAGRISNCFVVVLSIERFIAVRFPLTIKFTPLSQHPKKIIPGVCVFVSALLLPNIFVTEFSQSDKPYINTTRIKSLVTAYHDSTQEVNNDYTYFLLGFLRVFPVLVVLFLNLGIIIVLKSSNTNLKNMSTGDTKRQVKQIKITRMLVAISVIFLICIWPGLIHSLLTVFYPPYFSDNQNVWAAVRSIFPLFDTINSTVNFIVYIVLSEKFSVIFINTFCRKCKKKEPVTALAHTKQEAHLHL